MQTHIRHGKVNVDVDATLPVIECFCGAKILMIPNVKEMSKAIEAHAEEHAKKCKTAKEKEVEAEKVQDHLIMELLSKASEV